MELISLPISIVSLVISLGTFWLAFIRRGSLQMTKPTVVFFGFDHTPNPTAKLFIRTLLFSTATRGCVIEGMYAKIYSGNDSRIFSFWGYGETEKLTVGSGLYISQSGFSANHHFVLPAHDDLFQFQAGEYKIDIFASLVGKRKPIKLETIILTLSDGLANILAKNEGVLFERTIEGDYIGHGRK